MPRKAILATVTATAILATTGVAAAGPTGDRVTGVATNQYPTPAGPGTARLAVDARGTPGAAFGIVSAQGTPGTAMGEFAVSGAVTCLRVEGNRASIKYRFDEASGSAAPFKGGGVEVYVEDNGRARDANAFDPPQPAGVFDASATTCDDPNAATYDTVESGGYRVRDGRVR